MKNFGYMNSGYTKQVLILLLSTIFYFFIFLFFLKKGKGTRLHWWVFPTIDPYSINKSGIVEIASKNSIGSDSFDKLMCFRISTLEGLRSGPAL